MSEIINNNTFYSIEGPIEPTRNENGNIISITSSEHQLNEINQFVANPSIYNYYTSSYLGKIFDFDFTEFGISSDEKNPISFIIPSGSLLISQSEYDYLISISASLNEEVKQLRVITGSLEETIELLEQQIEFLLSNTGSISGSGGSGSGGGNDPDTTSAILEVQGSGGQISDVLTVLLNENVNNHSLILIGNGNLSQSVDVGNLTLKVAQGVNYTFNECISDLIISHNENTILITESNTKIFEILNVQEGDFLGISIGYKNILP